MASIMCPGCGAQLQDATIEVLNSGGTAVGSGGIVCPRCHTAVSNAALRELVPADPLAARRGEELVEVDRRAGLAREAVQERRFHSLMTTIAIGGFPVILGLISVGEFTDFTAGLVGLCGFGMFTVAVYFWRHLLDTNAGRQGPELLLQGALLTVLLAVGLGTIALGVERDNGRRGFYDRLAFLGLGLTVFALVAIGLPLAHTLVRRIVKSFSGG